MAENFAINPKRYCQIGFLGLQIGKIMEEDEMAKCKKVGTRFVLTPSLLLDLLNGETLTVSGAPLVWADAKDADNLGACADALGEMADALEDADDDDDLDDEDDEEYEGEEEDEGEEEEDDEND
jgi:hypothetical protein